MTQERLYAKGRTRKDGRLCHKLSKPSLQKFVSLADCPFALMFYLAILRPLHCPPMTVVSFFSFFTAKISCYILVKVLVHKGKLQVAYKSATCNLSLWIKARTEHACLKASEFLIIHASLSPFLSFICSKTVLLHCTAAPHTFAKRHRVCHHTDTLG